VIAGFLRGDRMGAFWSVRSKISDYGLADALPCPDARSAELGRLATRLAAMPDDTQERLINWGYAICDAAMRRWVDHSLPPPAGFRIRGGLGGGWRRAASRPSGGRWVRAGGEQPAFGRAGVRPPSACWRIRRHRDRQQQVIARQDRGVLNW
jgi:hypothetical protein